MEQQDGSPAEGFRAPEAAPQVETVESALEARAFLHDDPKAYRAGVRDALQAVTASAQPVAGKPKGTSPP